MIKTLTGFEELKNLELVEGQKYTMLFYTSFGFPVFLEFKFLGLEIKPYAQYREYLFIACLAKHKRIARRYSFDPNDHIVLWNRWVEPKKSNVDPFESWCFDDKAMNKLIASVPVQPIYRMKGD